MLGPQLGKHYFMIQYFCIYNNKDRYKIIHNYKFESTVYDKKFMNYKILYWRNFHDYYYKKFSKLRLKNSYHLTS